MPAALQWRRLPPLLPHLPLLLLPFLLAPLRTGASLSRRVSGRDVEETSAGNSLHLPHRSRSRSRSRRGRSLGGGDSSRRSARRFEVSRLRGGGEDGDDYSDIIYESEGQERERREPREGSGERDGKDHDQDNLNWDSREEYSRDRSAGMSGSAIPPSPGVDRGQGRCRLV